MTVYLNYEREPLVQVPTDGLQDQQLRGGLVQGEILSIGPRMTWEESGMVFTAGEQEKSKAAVERIMTYQLGCSKGCQAGLRAAGCFCPCQRRGWPGSRSGG